MEMETVELGTEVVVSQPPLGKREEPILTTAISCLWHSRRYVAAACLVGFIVAAGVAFTILPRYESTTRLMPPDRTETMGLALLASKMDDNLSSLVSNALGMKNSGALFIGILQSRTVEDRLIARFDLRAVYGVRMWKDARQLLEENTDINEDRKSGIIALTVTDTSPTRAAEIARGYLEELDRLNAELQRQLSNLRGTDAAASQGEVASSGAPYPSIKRLPLLGVTYYDLYRRVKIQEAVFETLTKQYEVAKIQEAKEIPSVRVLDVA